MAGSPVVLALNSGSSSLRIGCYVRDGAEERLVLTGVAEGIGREAGSLRLQTADGTKLLDEQRVCESQEEALDRIGAVLRGPIQGAPAAVGHRIVHGGPKLRTHQRITPEVLTELEAVQHLAPLHIPAALALIRKPSKCTPMCRRSPASTPPFTARCRTSQPTFRCPRATSIRVCNATDSTGSPASR